MTKQDLINDLRDAAEDDTFFVLQRLFAEYFAWWLQQPQVPEYDQFLQKSHGTESPNVKHHIYKLVFHALERLRNGSDDKTTELRQQWNKAMGESTADHSIFVPQPLITKSVGDGLKFEWISKLLAEVMDDEQMKDSLMSYYNAEWVVVTKAADKFIRDVYVNGLRDIVLKHGRLHNPLGGQFRDTSLGVTYQEDSPMSILSGPVIDISLKTDRAISLIHRKSRECNSASLNIRIKQKDELGLEKKCISGWPTPAAAIRMVDSVIRGWPDGLKDQKEKLTPVEKTE